mmetsp:Transcript_5637/g.6370  ORF Transcript_5637/g.6370 Transcript_5637/m.6370 type:complete len:507 (-) Transcript_5637:34-1554(-)|eukprot:CAMPEP_0205822544 /NCGR_PEP_ID=MMETSP0206-20130828/12969_1 /ASSEMBLY_ACC=CAM_ASM_000279 /TAXON_ID=36767 /ORGANISM="Euplotes focardii, Strain TN1" /LENGTH=506 /DNA_ID=CAMNT_0053118909 /DNA_START=14 /DNA_END=1534 /DNA_ORIENTATION=+
MKLFLLVLLLSVWLGSAQKAYPPGINVMVKNGIIDKIREIIVPDIMEEFKVIKPDDIDFKHSHYEVKLYDMQADIQPLNPDNVEIVMDETDNSLYVKVTDFETKFISKAYARVLFVHAHGDARIHTKIDDFSFKVEPKIKADGDLNDLDYIIDSVIVDVSRGDIHIEHLSIGIIPSWILAPLTNLIIDSVTSVYDLFEKRIDELVVKILNKHRATIPSFIQIPGYPISASLSFPNVPKLAHDMIKIPFDGSIYLASEEYHPGDDPSSEMPDYNPDNPNNIQIFVNEHVLKTTFQTFMKSGLSMTINQDTLTPLALPDNIMKAEYISMLFPKLRSHYEKDTPIIMNVGVDQTLATEMTFAPNQLNGKFSPTITFHAGDDVAMTVSITTVFQATVNFEVKEKETFMTGSIDSLDLQDFTFVQGTVEDSDLGDILEHFKELITTTVINLGNGFLKDGINVPVLPLIKEAFEIDLEDIEMDLKDKYLEASFTLDIHQRQKLIQKLLKSQL